MLFRFMIAILFADAKVPHQQTTAQTTATQKAEQISKNKL